MGRFGKIKNVGEIDFELLNKSVAFIDIVWCNALPTLQQPQLSVHTCYAIVQRDGPRNTSILVQAVAWKIPELQMPLHQSFAVRRVNGLEMKAAAFQILCSDADGEPLRASGGLSMCLWMCALWGPLNTSSGLDE